MVLRQILLHAPAYAMLEPRMLVSDARERFDENGELFDEQTRKRMQRFIESLVEWTERFRKAVAAHGRSDLDAAMIEEERKGMRGDPDQEAKGVVGEAYRGGPRAARLPKARRQRPHDRPRAGWGTGGAGRNSKIAERKLEALRGRRERIEEMEWDRDALLDNYARMASEALNVLAPEERHQVYRILRLQAAMMMDGTLGISGTFGEGDVLCPTTTPSWAHFGSTKKSDLRFHALLFDGAREVRFERVWAG
jgi:hypothetical protein